jgi:hypothetical protein
MNQINPSQFMYYDNGMMNFNYFQNFMGDDMKNMLYMQILQDNIALREEIKRRDMEDKSSCQFHTEPSQHEQPSVTKIESFSSK